MPIIPRDSEFGGNPQPNVWDQQVPFDFASGFSGQWVFGPFRIDQSTGDLTNDTGIGNIIGFNVGASGFSGFTGSSGFSGESGFSGLGISGFSGISGAGTAMFHQFILMGA